MGGIHNKGFSLIELMVAMVIALVIMTGVVNSFLASKDTYHYNEELGFIQENARFALDRLTRDIREAGYFGCDTNNGHIVDVINSSDVLYKRIGLQGFDDSQGVSAFPAEIRATVNSGTDAIIVRRGDTDNSMTIAKHNYASAQFSIVGTHNFKPGTIFIISDADCQHQGIFEMTSPTNSSGGSSLVVHNSGNSIAPGNCAKLIKGDESGDCSECSGPLACTWKASNASYSPDSTLMTMIGNIYYIAPSAIDSSVPALYITGIGYGNGSGTTTTTNELVAGVVNMQIEYGMDETAIADGVADQYLKAQSIPVDEDETGSSGYKAWNRVVSVRLQLVLRSRSQVLPVAESRTLLGVTYNDRYLYQLISTTVQIRNPYLG